MFEALILSTLPSRSSEIASMCFDDFAECFFNQLPCNWEMKSSIFFPSDHSTIDAKIGAPSGNCSIAKAS